MESRIIPDKLFNSDKCLGELPGTDAFYKAHGYSVIAGVDEAGRGALAGPVCAAAVILGDEVIDGLDDSKKLTAERREALYDDIFRGAKNVGIGMAGPGRIDEINILWAAMEAMHLAVRMLGEKPDLVLVDGGHVPKGLDNAVAVIKGDTKSKSIMAGSIIAKVTRDRYMVLLDRYYPGYGFRRHKGYAVKAHFKALEEIGLTSMHRLSFSPCSEVYESLIESGKVSTMSTRIFRERIV